MHICSYIKASTLWAALICCCGQSLAESSPVKLMGAMEYRDAWLGRTGWARQVGVYSFSPDNFQGFTPESPIVDYNQVTLGGAYHDGYFYYQSGEVTAVTSNIVFHKRNTQSWAEENSWAHTAMPTPNNALTMAVNPVDGQMVALCMGDSYMNREYTLRDVDPGSGDMTDIAVVNGLFSALAFDAQGQLWGVRRNDSYYQPAQLCKIDKATGAVTLVGNLGVCQRDERNTAMAFDYDTGRLFWTGRTFPVGGYDSDITDYLLEIDPATGASTVLANLGGTKFAAIWVDKAIDSAPADITDLAMEGSKLSFTLPAKTAGGGDITGTLTAKITVNGSLAQTMEGLAPGSRATTADLALEAGRNVIAVTAYNAQGKASQEASIVYYPNGALPGKVENLKVTVTDNCTKALLTWNAPALNADGTPASPSSFTYKIVREPAMVTIEGITATTYTDIPDEPMLWSRYTVYAVNAAGESEPVNAGPVHVGQPYELPYHQTFSSRRDFNTFSRYNATGFELNATNIDDPELYGNCWLYDSGNQYAIWWLSYSYVYAAYADDWMISPTLQLDPDKLYKVQWDTKGFSSVAANEEGFPTSWDVYAMADTLTSTADKTLIVHEDYKSHKDFKATFSATFTPAPGQDRIAFHVTNNGRDHVMLDNIHVTIVGDASAPGAPTDFTATRHNGKVDLSVKAPARAADGSDMSKPMIKLVVKQSDNGRVIKTINNPAPGQTYTCTDNAPERGINHYVAWAETMTSKGAEAQAQVDMTPDVPKEVASVTITVSGTGSDALVSWQYPDDMLGANGQPLEPGDLRYKVTRLINGVDTYNQVLAENQAETSYYDRAVADLLNKRQGTVTYNVTAVTAGGSSFSKSAVAVLGRSYVLPVEETFDFNGLEPWRSVSVSGSGQWSMASKGYSPMTDAHDATGVASFSSYSGGVADYLSPYIDLRGMMQPKLTFWRYVTTGADASGLTLQVGLQRYVNGQEQPVEMISPVYDAKGTSTGWVQETIDLEPYADSPRAALVFRGSALYSGASLHIDEVKIDGLLPERDLRVNEFSGPAVTVMGRPNIFTAEIENYGKTDYADATASIVVADQVMTTIPVSLAAGASAIFDLAWNPSLASDEGYTSVYVKVQAEGDEKEGNNTAEFSTNVTIPNLPYVTDLTAQRAPEGSAVLLAWGEPTEYPRATSIVDNFESYDNFLIDGIGQWKVIDIDGAATIGGISSNYGNYYWENCSRPQAYIVFNPKAVGVEALADAHSGAKCLVSFVSAGGENDDWLISPLLSGKAQQISFYARAMNPAYGQEKFEIWASQSGSEQADFALLQQAVNLNGCDWSRFTCDLPEGTRHFALRCVSHNQFGFMVDDIKYQPASEPCELWGYNVERDGQRIAADLGETAYADAEAAPDRTLTYRVNANYAEGESVYSKEVKVPAQSGLDAPAAYNALEARGLRGLLSITAPQGAAVDVTDASGRLVARYVSAGREEIPLAPGVYMVSSPGFSPLKVSVR